MDDSSSQYSLYQTLHQQFLNGLQRLKQAHEQDCESWYQKANSNAQTGDYPNALTGYQQAANRLYAPACYRVAFFHNADDHELGNHRPVPQNKAKALNWFMRGAQYGHVKSMIQVAERLAYRGRDTNQPGDFETAIEFATKAINQAQARDERQAQKTLEKVRRLQAEYRISADNDPKAMHLVAGHLLNNTGGIEAPADDNAQQTQLKEALRLAKQSRQLGHQGADVILHDIEQALEHLKLKHEASS